MSGKNWAPVFIQLTQKTGDTYWIQIAEIGCFEVGTFGETQGSYITLRGAEEERFVLETPEQIADLIRLGGRTAPIVARKFVGHQQEESARE